MLLGVMLVVSPGLSFAAGNSFVYTNPGQRTFLNVTNNAEKASFNITAPAYIPVVINGTDQFLIGNYSWIGGFQDYVNNKTGGFQAIDWHLANTTALNLPTSGYFENSTMGVQELLAKLASTYLVTGVGNGDSVKIVSGATPDVYSVVTPGTQVGVTIISGPGSSTFAVQVGTNSTITISPSPTIQNATTGTTSVFNIVYDSNSY